MAQLSGYALSIMTKGKNFDQMVDGIKFFADKPPFWYRVYMFDDVRTVILPTGEITPLPHDSFQIGSFALALCKEKIKEALLNQ